MLKQFQEFRISSDPLAPPQSIFSKVDLNAISLCRLNVPIRQADHQENAQQIVYDFLFQAHTHGCIYVEFYCTLDPFIAVKLSDASASETSDNSYYSSDDEDEDEEEEVEDENSFKSTSSSPSRSNSGSDSSSDDNSDSADEPFNEDLYAQFINRVKDGIFQAKAAFGIEAKVILVLSNNDSKALCEMQLTTILSELNPAIAAINLMGNIDYFSENELSEGRHQFENHGVHIVEIQELRHNYYVTTHPAIDYTFASEHVQRQLKSYPECYLALRAKYEELCQLVNSHNRLLINYKNAPNDVLINQIYRWVDVEFGENSNTVTVARGLHRAHELCKEYEAAQEARARHSLAC